MSSEEKEAKKNNSTWSLSSGCTLCTIASVSASVRRRVIETPATIIVIVIETPASATIIINAIDRDIDHCHCYQHCQFFSGIIEMFALLHWHHCGWYHRYSRLWNHNCHSFHQIYPISSVKVIITNFIIESINLDLRFLLVAAKALRPQILFQNLDKILELFSCPGSSIPDLGGSVTDWLPL